MAKAKRKKDKLITVDSDETVNEMLRTWDIIQCKRCHKEISLLDAVSVNGGLYFVCKGCARRK